jgi:hypothetical protein
VQPNAGTHASGFTPAWSQLGTPTFGGLFEAGLLRRQAIAVTIVNLGPYDTYNAVLKASIPKRSHVKLTKSVATFRELKVGKPSRALLEADFRKAIPGAYPLTLLTLTYYPRRGQRVTGTLRVARAKPRGVRVDVWTAATDIGSIHFEASKTYGGVSLGTLSTLTSFQLGVSYDKPFSGQLGPLPYGDLSWTTVAAASIGAQATGYIAKAVGRADPYTYAIPPAASSAVKNFAADVTASGIGAALLDGKDPFRRGQEHTLPQPGERTVSEDLAVTTGYPSEPTVGTRHPIDVSWEYRRVTTGQTYTYGVSERVVNDHAANTRSVTVDTTRVRPRAKVVVTALTDQRLRGDRGYFVAHVFRASDPNMQLTPLVAILTDDGAGADARAGDARFTGTLRAPRRPGAYNVIALGYEMDPVPKDAPPVVAAQHVSGFLVSAPKPGPGRSLTPDATFTVAK